ncbi:MAG: hypothetical protein JSR21_18770 [Proteobacteria bacterium]|nr:hypothetical protein [Pseudomonadota bacterium]
MSHSSLAYARTPPARRAAPDRVDPLSLTDDPIPGARPPAAATKLHWLPAAIALALFAAGMLDLLPQVPW